MTARPIISAADWYESKPAGDGVTWIREPWIKEYYRCNLWHVRGRDRDLLVDSGMGVVPLRRSFPLLTGRPIVAVASHAHFDHIGAHHEFEERAIHSAEADIIEHPTRASTVADRYVTDEIFDGLPPAPYESATYAVKGAPATRVLEDGDILDLGDRRLEVIHAPGHSPGSIALWEAETGILFSGDAVYDGPLVDDAYHSNIPAYVRTMERLADLAVRVVHGGHFDSFDGPRYRELIREYLDGKRKPGAAPDPSPLPRVARRR